MAKEKDEEEDDQEGTAEGTEETAEEEEMPKEEKVTLASLKAALQDRIYVKIAKQANKYVEVAEKQEDIEDGINFYWDALSLFDSLEQEESSQIDESAPQPAEIVTYAYVMNPLKTSALLPAAFSSMTTAELYDALLMARQKAVAAWANLTNPANLPDDAAVKDTFNGIVDIIEQVGIAHYEIVRAGLFLHVVLARLYATSGLLDFLASKGKVEKQLVKYNAHSPHLALEIEEQELNGVQRLLALIASIHDYLMSAAYYDARRAIATATPAPTPAITAAQAAGEPAAATYTAAINLVQHMPTKTASEKRVLAIKLAKAGGNGKGKGKQVLATAATTAMIDAAFIPVSPVVIDMSEARNPLDILNDIATAISALVEQSMAFIAQLKRLARPINFNIYSLQFGSTTPLQDNRAMMQKLRKDIASFVLKDLKTSATQPPMLILKHQVVTQEFASHYGAGPAVGAVALSPGEEMEDTSESSATTKRITEKSDSVFDAKTTSVKDSLNKSRQNVLSQTNTDTKELSTYLDTSRQVDTEESLSVGVSASVDIMDCVSIDVDVDWDKSTSVSEGVEQGSNSTANSTREQGVTNTDSMVQDHVEESTANRERTQTTSEKEEEELSSKNKVVRKLKNINRASATTVIFCKLIQAYNSVTTTPGFRIQFANGSVITECSVDQLRKNIIEKYIRPDAADTRKAIWDLVKANALVRDYQGRFVNLLDEAGGTERLLGTTGYFKLLRKQKLGEVAEDLPLKPYKSWIKGVVLSTRVYTMPQAATVRRVVVSKPALDTYEKRLMELEIKKTEAQVRLVENQVANREALLEFFKSITDQELKVRAAFLFMLEATEIVQKGTLSAVAGIGNGAMDTTGLAKLKAHLQNMKLDV